MAHDTPESDGQQQPSWTQNGYGDSKDAEIDNADEYSTQHVDDILERFRRFWPTATDDNRLTLFGFRRFRTVHLLNLRFLEDELTDINRKLCIAAEVLDIPLPPKNKLGLRHGTPRDPSEWNAALDREFFGNMRRVVKEYGAWQPP
jgi:hypothetical protein